MKKLEEHRTWYGTTTVGEKGQVVIPADARERMSLHKGDKLLVFGFGDEMLAFSKVSQLEKLADYLTKRLQGIQETLKKVNSK